MIRLLRAPDSVPFFRRGSSRRQRRLLRLTAWLMLFAPLVCNGCLPQTTQSANVDPSKARTTLKTVLDSWQGGGTIEQLGQQTPAIVVQDFDWLGGTKLVKYELVGDGRPEGPNLIAQVKLTVADPQGAQEERLVTYVVGTAPTLTVFRDMFR